MFEGLSFLTNMLSSVFVDLAPFLQFFGIFIITFSLLILVLMPENIENYQGTGYFAYLVMAFRTSVGDFSLDQY